MLFTLTALLTLMISPLNASEKTSTNLYQCVDKLTLQQNPDCVASVIDQGTALQKQLTAINDKAAVFNDQMVMAVMTFNRQDNSIEIVSISDKKQPVEETQSSGL